MSWLAKKLDLSHNFFEDIMAAREDQTEFLADLMMEHDGPYYILGKTFKEETNLILGSPAILLGNILSERNVEYIHYDPFIDPIQPEFKPGVYFIATKHAQFKNYEFPEGSVVIDVWRYLDITDENVKYIKVGN
jgi:UDPglucose 6-dehydrogenase